MSSSTTSAALAGSDHGIDGFSIFTLIVFFAVNVLVIFPLSIPIPGWTSRLLKKILLKTRIWEDRQKRLGNVPSTTWSKTGGSGGRGGQVASHSEKKKSDEIIDDVTMRRDGTGSRNLEVNPDLSVMKGQTSTAQHRSSTSSTRRLLTDNISFGSVVNAQKDSSKVDTDLPDTLGDRGVTRSQNNPGENGDEAPLARMLGVKKEREHSTITDAKYRGDPSNGLGPFSVPFDGLKFLEGDQVDLATSGSNSVSRSQGSGAALALSGPTNQQNGHNSTRQTIHEHGIDVIDGQNYLNDEYDEPWRFELGLTTAPFIGVLLLLATTSIGGETLRNGIVGTQGVKPYDIMTLFISLAYISLSLDCTGLLRFMAFWVALKGGKSGRRLYLFFYLFFFLFGTLVGNDPIILSGTSFLAYFSRIAGITPPRAWIFAQFAACNVASAVLVSSNPTNLVLTGAYNISFLVYSAWLVLPVLATAIVLYPLLLFWTFNDVGLIPRELEPPDVDPKTALIDKNGAIFGGVLLGITLAALVGLSAGGLLHGVEGVWTVTAPAAIVMVCRDLWHDRSSQSAKQEMSVKEDEIEMNDLDLGRPELEHQGEDDLSGVRGVIERQEMTTAMEDNLPGHQQLSIPQRPGGPRRRTVSTLEASPQLSSFDQSKPAQALRDISSGPSRVSPPRTVQSMLRTLSLRFPTFAYVFVRLPLPLLPFAFSMFILVEALQYVGWIKVFGGWWKAWVDVSGVGGAVFLMAVLSVLGCNIFGTNIGATILLSRVLQQWSGSGETVSQRTLYGSVFTLALGSNYGAFSYTFSASLAGLLWKTILLQKSIQVRRWEFAKHNSLLVAVCMVVGSLIIAGEVCIIYKD